MFEKTLSDLVRGIRAHRGSEVILELITDVGTLLNVVKWLRKLQVHVIYINGMVHVLQWLYELKYSDSIQLCL